MCFAKFIGVKFQNLTFFHLFSAFELQLPFLSLLEVCRFVCIFCFLLLILQVQLNKEEATLRKTFNVLSVIALVLTIIGALNWLLVGIFTFNFVTWITFGMVWLERLIYILVGIAGIYMLVWLIVSRAHMVEGEKTQRDYKYSQHKTLRNE